MNNTSKKILASVLLLGLCASSIPAVTLSAAETTKVSLDGKLTEVGNVHSYTIADNGGKKKATFYAALTEEGDLYLACDAYHDIYISNGGEWWQNTNLEFWLHGDQKYVSAKNKTDLSNPAVTVVGGRMNTSESKMITEELTGAGTKYHTTTETLVRNFAFTTNRDDGLMKMGVAWKTIGDTLTDANHNNSDWWNSPDGGQSKLFVCKGGLYATEEEALAARNPGNVLNSPAPVTYGYIGSDTASGSAWTVDGANYTLTGRELGKSFNSYLLGKMDDCHGHVTMSATFSATSNNEQGFLVAAGGFDRSDLVAEDDAVYYLIDAGYDNGKLHLAIEKNNLDWGGWVAEANIEKGTIYADSYTVKVCYSDGKIDVFVNDEFVLAYTDTGYQLPGCYYGLASKTMNSTISNVSVDTAEVEVRGAYEIRTPEEFSAFTALSNKLGKGYLAGKTAIIMNDLDMSGVEFAPFNNTVVLLNGNGHTISGLNMTVENAGSGNYGLIARALTNGGGHGLIQNLTLKDCTLTVNGANGARVGAVVGFGDRGSVNAITLENVTVTVNGTADVGGMIGRREWQNSHEENDVALKNLTFENVTLNAPDCENVGAVVGYAYEVTGKFGNISGEVKVDAKQDLPRAELVGGTGNNYNFILAEGATDNLTVKNGYTAGSTAGGKLSTTGNSAYIQKGTVGGKNAIRLLIVSNTTDANGNTFTATFKDADGNVLNTLTRKVGDETTQSFTEVNAAGETFTAGDGCVIYGIALYEADTAIDFATVTLTLTTADGVVYEGVQTYAAVFGA